ncbi:hypothetical protein [Oceanobacillus chungangensis]|uniref:hypothetical protein n=1 Tax=Oceanobacillus chungangensis TaxID=1229152 RepID=UPI0014762132|nr:hypothetical protein [Oceanobacillus chungangensis]
MKIALLGIAIILFGIAIILVYSSTGLGYSSGTKIGFGISILGLIVSMVGCFINDK